jgi:hypothetical protein
MALDRKVKGDAIAVSGLRQSALGIAATLDKVIYFSEDSQLNVVEEREGNAGEKTGHVEATDVDVRDRSAEGTLTIEKATPDSILWMAAFAFGNHAVTTPAGGVYRHTSKVASYPDHPDYFTAAHRKGGASGAAAIDFRRHVNLALSTLELSVQKGEFLRASSGILGTGKSDDGIRTEAISAANDATSIALGEDPLGDDPANVTVWADLDGDGIYETEVFASAYSAGTNALTITSLGGDGSTISYRASYAPKSSVSGYGWTDLSALAPAEEFKIKVGNIQFRIGGKYTEPAGVPTFTGGQLAGCEIESFQYRLERGAEVGRCWRQGDTETAEATSVDLGDVVQTITLTREVRDYLLRQKFDANEALALYFDALGPVITGAEKFFVKGYFPRCKLLTKPFQANDGKWVEEGNLLVLKDAVNNWPTAVIVGQNEVATYLA